MNVGHPVEDFRVETRTVLGDLTMVIPSSRNQPLPGQGGVVITRIHPGTSGCRLESAKIFFVTTRPSAPVMDHGCAAQQTASFPIAMTQKGATW